MELNWTDAKIVWTTILKNTFGRRKIDRTLVCIIATAGPCTSPWGIPYKDYLWSSWSYQSVPARSWPNTSWRSMCTEVRLGWHRFWGPAARMVPLEGGYKVDVLAEDFQLLPGEGLRGNWKVWRASLLWCRSRRVRSVIESLQDREARQHLIMSKTKATPCKDSHGPPTWAGGRPYVSLEATFSGRNYGLVTTTSTSGLTVVLFAAMCATRRSASMYSSPKECRKSANTLNLTSDGTFIPRQPSGRLGALELMNRSLVAWVTSSCNRCCAELPVT